MALEHETLNDHTVHVHASDGGWEVWMAAVCGHSVQGWLLHEPLHLFLLKRKGSTTATTALFVFEGSTGLKVWLGVSYRNTLICQ